MIKKLAIYSLLVILVAACSSGPSMYSSEKKNGVDFSKYKTYAFLPTKDTSFAKVVNKKKLVAAMTEEAFRIMDSKGMKYDTINPDCLFRYSLVMKKDYSVSRVQDLRLHGQRQSVCGAVDIDRREVVLTAWWDHAADRFQLQQLGQ